MVEPNWDKINAKKRKEIMLGQAMNQAKDILIASKKEYTFEDWDALEKIGIDEEKIYKEWAKLFFKWNREIYDEAIKNE
jgi:hypothetical protein